VLGTGLDALAEIPRQGDGSEDGICGGRSAWLDRHGVGAKSGNRGIVKETFCPRACGQNYFSGTDILQVV
jgi:hypothetical protein